MKYRYKVRFHLGAGEHFMSWRIEDRSLPDAVEFRKPEEDFSILMSDCRLVNQVGGAKKIFNGGNKTVVAWIECNHLYLGRLPVIDNTLTEVMVQYRPHAGFLWGRDLQTPITYNPKVTPFWMSEDKIVDKKEYYSLVTRGNKVFGYKDEQLHDDYED